MAGRETPGRHASRRRDRLVVVGAYGRATFDAVGPLLLAHHDGGQVVASASVGDSLAARIAG